MSKHLISVVPLQICPSLLVKKDRGRPTNPTARPKAYGEVNIATDVPGAELLHIDSDDEQESGDSDDSVCSGSDDENQLCTDNTGSDDDEAEDNSVVSDDEESSDSEIGVSDDDDDDDVEVKEDDLEDSEQSDEEVGEVSEYEDNDGSVEAKSTLKETSKKRKFADFNGTLTAADTSLRALKKLTGTTTGQALPESEDGFLSNEDFQRIKKLKV